ncbi:hypothetical protein PYCCODRAFT_1460532 [Trametes coccinea BRFM310]|uniref:F-box domain-containing protein n=1 Tax=Trametes coccinea (strain BRFM310) TaxID=1353009 RepID=A0A1Y2IFH5_TRAC3|nr:hypothetical protein PYCCODRAFT_1460532 [Trametes coccinea BRFM310]
MSSSLSLPPLECGNFVNESLSLNKPLFRQRLGRPRAKTHTAFSDTQRLLSPPCHVNRSRERNGRNRALSISGSTGTVLQRKEEVTMPANASLSLSLSNLNGDVLSEIASYVHGRDALSLALTARHLCDFTLHRVAVMLVCRTRSDLVCLHQHLLAGEPKRAVYLRSLTILGSTFMERPWQEDPNWIFPKNTYEYSNASLLGDILQAAPNLTHIMLEHSAPLFHHDPRIRTALASMTRLVRLELCHMDSNALPLFQELRSRPRVLHLSPIKVDSPVEVHRLLSAIQDILESLSSITELHALDLDMKNVPSHPDFSGSQTSLPQIRQLSVHWWHPHLDVATVFPNLEAFDQHISSIQLARPPERPLRRLSVTELHTFDATRHPVHLLHLRRYPRELRSFRRTVYETSPVGIALHCFIDTPTWLKYWRQLARAAPRLRFMDVHCHTWERRHEPGWANNFVQTLRGYSLVCIRIVAPQPPTSDSLDAPWHEEDIQTFAELPDRIMQVMPSLRYIAWAAKRRAPGGHPDDYAWYEDAYDCAPAEYTWYRIERGGSDGARVLKGLSPSQGERVRRFLLDSDLEAITNIDEHLRL